MKKVLIRKIIFFLLSFYYLPQVFSQADPDIPTVFPPSPNAASIGIYGQVPVSLFSGLPQISIPIGEVSIPDAALPISLNYHGGGIRPEHHPGWVGSGWSLNAGGVITRKVNGAVDEFLIHGANPIDQYGDYLNYGKADNNNWSASDTLKSYGESMLNIHYPAPDEFVFNFGKYSGSFYKNHKGKWQVKSSDPIFLTVTDQVKDSFYLTKQSAGTNDLFLRRIFYKFTLTTPDGCKYIFGGVPESIEFTRTASYDINQAEFNTGVVPTSWYLTKIINRRGQEINLTYVRDGIQATMATNLVRYYYTSTTGSDNVAHIKQQVPSIINTSHLSSITAPNQLVKFARFASNELSFTYGSLLNPALNYLDLSGNGGTQTDILNAIYWPRLDSISFYSDASTFLSKFAFYYKPSSTLRLTLDSLKEIGSGNVINQPFIFSYDATPLPAYNSEQLDHWGFYNGADYFTLYPKSPLNYVSTDVPTYTVTKNFNVNMMKAGVLNSIRYPTGGITKFTYEPHEYRKIAKRFPFTVTDTGVNVQCGGLRIKKIENRDPFGSVLTSKDYFYRINYQTGGTASSGILAGYPQYLDQGQVTYQGNTLSYWYWYNYSIQPLSFTEGNHVTYSEVVEKSADNSYTIFTYSNHDQGSYLDQDPVNRYMNRQLWAEDPETSRSLERGKLLTQTEYSSSNVKLKKIKIDYDTSATMYAEAVRMVKVNRRNFNTPLDGGATAYLTYTFPRFVIRETDTLWDQSGANPVVTVKNYRYNNYRLKSVDSSTNSTAAIVKTTYKYPFDLLGGSDPTGIFQKMVDSNTIQTPVEMRDSVGSAQTRFTKTYFYSPYIGLFVPQRVDVQHYTYSNDTALLFHNYDTKGNLQSVSKEKNIRISYLWNYKQTNPIAEVKNASLSDIAYTSFESDSTGNWNNYAGTITTITSGTFPPTGKKYYSLTPTNTLVKTGLSSSKTYILSYWTQNASAFTVSGTVTGFPASGRTIAGSWKYFEHKITGQTSITLSGTGNIDEVRLYPVDAQMVTYTYDPLVGVTGNCDANNRITYYEYDGLQRLILIRDQDRNIIKKFEYKQANPVIFYNQQASGGFQRKNCTGCLTGSNVTYIIDDSTYTSTVDQETANSLAVAAVQANGQAYANTNGTCSTPPNTSFNGNNGNSVAFSVHCNNLCTGTNYNFTLPASATNYSFGSLPAGTYDVTMAAPGGVGTYTYRLNGIWLINQTGPGTIRTDLSGTNQLIITP